MANLKPIGEAQWLITVEGIQGLWDKVTPIKQTVEKIKYTDPQKLVIRIHPGARSNEEVTISKKYDAEGDKTLISWVQERQKGKNTTTPFTVTISPVYPDVDGTAYEGSAKFNLTGCMLLDVTYPGMDRESKNLSMFEMTFYFEEIKVV